GIALSPRRVHEGRPFAPRPHRRAARRSDGTPAGQAQEDAEQHHVPARNELELARILPARRAASQFLAGDSWPMVSPLTPALSPQRGEGRGEGEKHPLLALCKS